MSDRSPTLAEEVRYLHDSLFAVTLDDEVVHRYAAAHLKLFPNEETSLPVARVVSRRLDVEAVEFVLRRRQAGAQLTRKIKILCYLVEVRNAYQSEFFTTKSERTRAAVLLSAAVVRSIWKLCKGEYLVRRHGLL
jgi:hypothetical protein